MSVRREWAALALLTVGVALQLWPAAGPGRLPESLDLMLQYVPNVGYFQRRLDAAELPLWNPYLGTGMPFAADPGTGAWYLPAWPVLLALPLDAAVRALIWLHLAWAAAGTYAFCRGALGTGRLAAGVAASSFALTTWLPGLAGMPVVLTSISWIPWLLLLGVRSAARGGRWLAALAAAGTLQAASGWPAGAYLAWLALGILLVGLATPPRRWGGIVAAGAVALALAGVLLVPAFELISETNYAETRSVEAAARAGYLTLLSWLRPAGGSGSLESSQLYAGVAALVLAALGAAGGHDRRRAARALTALALFSLLVGLGSRTPLFAALYAWLPGFRIVYLPARLGILAALATACLAALGAQALLDGRVSRRRAAWALALVGALVPLTLLQFWHSEGYDNFRRLLTNLGRMTGGPFIGRAQELHYVVFVVGAAALLIAAVWRRVGAAVPMLCAVAVTDGVLAHQLAPPPAFDPAAWYAPALERAPTLRLGAERVAGAQWHGTQHFLTDFPRSADPAQLPPNLALLAGVRDAQGYNPLLLRRAALYFARANVRARGDAQPDDHWLWLEDFRIAESERLAVSQVLVPEDAAWRARGVRVMGPTTLRAGAAPARATLSPALAPAGRARLHVISYLGEATAIRSGEAVGNVTIVGPAGTQREALRAGEHTAEWAYGRPDVARTVAHRQAPIALETQLVDAVAGRFRVYEYRASFGVTLDGAATEVLVTPALPPSGQTTLNVAGVWLEDTTSFPPVAPGLLRSERARPRFDTTAGTVTTIEDAPERITLRVASPSGATVTVADASYPGWMARVDGAPVSIRVADGLFRAVDVPAGEHTLALTYEPVSLRLGAALSAAGVLALVGLLLWPSRSTISSRWRRKTSRP